MGINSKKLMMNFLRYLLTSLPMITLMSDLSVFDSYLHSNPRCIISSSIVLMPISLGLYYIIARLLLISNFARCTPTKLFK